MESTANQLPRVVLYVPIEKKPSLTSTVPDNYYKVRERANAHGEKPGTGEAIVFKPHFAVSRKFKRDLQKGLTQGEKD